MDGRPKTNGAVYRDEAATLMAAAAREAAQTRPQVQPFPRRPAAPPVLAEQRRNLPYPKPVGTNDNDDADAAPPPRERRRLSLGRTIAKIAILPFYVALAVASLAVIGLFVRGFLG